jgi:hypothetical protein
MSSPLDSKLCRELGDYVETLTHSGQKVLDKDTLKKLKNICKYVHCHTLHSIIFESYNHICIACNHAFPVTGFLMAMWNMPTIYLSINLREHTRRFVSVPFKYVMNSLGKTNYLNSRLQASLPY